MGIVFLILFVTRSITVPSGQIHPQKKRPSTIERTNISAPGRRMYVKLFVARR
jgi:hypothetical protein